MTSHFYPVWVSWLLHTASRTLGLKRHLEGKNTTRPLDLVRQLRPEAVAAANVPPETPKKVVANQWTTSNTEWDSQVAARELEQDKWDQLQGPYGAIGLILITIICNYY